MADVALGVRNSGTDGTTPLGMRLSLASLFANNGILDGLAVTGKGSLSYSVSSGTAVCSKGSGDGRTIAHFSGGSTPTVSGNTSGYPRIDTVWVTSHDIDQGDPDNHVTVGVTQGTPAATPARPSIPTYATPLAYMRLPAGATSTSGATRDGRAPMAIPYASSRGIIFDDVNRTNSSSDLNFFRSRVTAVGGSVYVPTARLLTFRMSVGCMCADGVWKFANNHTMGSVVVHLVVDGSDVYNAEVMVNDFCGVVQGLSYTQVVGAGNHAVRMDYEQKSDTADRILMKYSAKQWPGQRLQVVDEGAA